MRKLVGLGSQGEFLLINVQFVIQYRSIYDFIQ